MHYAGGAMTTPPVWDLTSFFPSFDGPEYRAFLAALNADVAKLLADAERLPTLDAASAERSQIRRGEVGIQLRLQLSGRQRRLQLRDVPGAPRHPDSRGHWKHEVLHGGHATGGHTAAHG